MVSSGMRNTAGKRGGIDSRFILLVSIILFISILCSHTAAGFGISAPYMENDTLRLEAGQSYAYTISVQNGDNASFDIDLNYTSDENIARLRPRDMLIPAESYNNTFIFDISIPDAAKPGKEYVLSYSVRPIPNKTGSASENIELRRKLNILVTDKNGQGHTSWPDIRKIMGDIPGADTSKNIISFAAVIVVLIILYFIIRRLWSLSKNMSAKIYSGKNMRPQTPISGAKTLDEINKLIDIIPQEQFELKEIRDIFSENLERIGEKSLSIKISGATSKKDIIDKTSKSAMTAATEHRSMNRLSALRESLEQGFITLEEFESMTGTQKIRQTEKKLSDELVTDVKDITDIAEEGKIEAPRVVPVVKEIKSRNAELFKRRVNDYQAFRIHDGTVLYSLDDLISILESISIDSFNHHTKEGRNDFASWIEGVFGDMELARLARNTENKKELKKALELYKMY